MIAELFGVTPAGEEDPNQRANCCCVEAEDMGAYDTCQMDCLYCYANRTQKMIESRIVDHDDPESSALIGQCEKEFFEQLSLFSE